MANSVDSLLYWVYRTLAEPVVVHPCLIALELNSGDPERSQRHFYRHAEAAVISRLVDALSPPLPAFAHALYAHDLRVVPSLLTQSSWPSPGAQRSALRYFGQSIRGRPPACDQAVYRYLDGLHSRLIGCLQPEFERRNLLTF